MKKIELLIKISEDSYKATCNGYMLPQDVENVVQGIKNGTQLPKGHGDLKDFQKIYADMTEKVELARQRVIDTPTNSPCYMRYVSQLSERTAFKEMLFDAPIIIKADKAESEK